MTNAYPLTNEEGLATQEYTFKLTNDGTLPSDFRIYLDDVDSDSGQTRINDKYMRYNLIKNSSSTTNDLISTLGTNPNRILTSGYIAAGKTISYSLRVWIDYDAGNEVQNKTFKAKLRVDAVQTKERATGEKTDTSGANEPELAGDMIPVIYDSSFSNWVKAGVGNWYNYDEQEWANAVTVTQTNRAKYTSASAGTTISMDDINTMFVLVPRYSYTIGNTYGVQGYGGSTPSAATPGAIDIQFVDSGTVDNGSAAYTGSTPSEYYTSPAFCWGDTCDTSRSDSINKELSGLWVGKFEISAPSITSNTVQVPIIKPNVISWRSAQVATFFTAIQQNMNGSAGTTNYGFNGSDYDAHMMKNTEWGAAAYLSQSKYGKYGNTNYSGANKEVYQNKSSSYTTGMSNGTPSTSTTNTQVAYNTQDTGVGASTTGNITGIYDMSGGAWEYVMGNMMISGNTEPEVGYTTSSQSGFMGKIYDGGAFTAGTGTIAYPSKKYVNQYNYGTSYSDYTRAITGDATKETKSWYGDNASFVYSNGPFFIRGGYFDSRCGSFWLLRQ